MSAKLAPSRAATSERAPKLGLVCMTSTTEVRFRTITRTRYLSLSRLDRESKLLELYTDNLERLFAALDFCRARGIRLYRAISGLFPMSDEPCGERVLRGLEPRLAEFGRRAVASGIRVVQHPDQFVVLSSMNPAVVRQSVTILEKHALAFDLLGLPRSAWSAMILHGGKAGRADELIRVIAGLPEGIRSRLVLENDEYAYSSEEILAVCRRAGVPMVFDAHHHAVHEQLDSYEHPSVEHFTRAAARTWPKREWQIVHLSNGLDAFVDPRHSDLIHTVPSCYARAPWVEVEAKGKERAIDALRAAWPLAQ